MAAVNVRITSELKNPTEVGVYHRLVCMTGPNKGKVYYLNGKRIILGRNDKADIQIVDTKISREHAEFSLVDGGYVITDLSNQNGIIINDKKVTQKRLADGEKIVIGQSVIKYSFIEVNQAPTALVTTDENNVVPLNAKDGKKGAVKPKIAIKTITEEDDDEPAPVKKAEGKNKTIFVVIILAALFFIFSGDDNANKNVKKTKSNQDNFDIESETAGAKKVTKEDPEIRRKFESLIHSGRREFREGNYFRAMEEFRRADLLIPNSGLAGYLMSRSKQRLDEDVQKNFNKANIDLDAKKYQSAIISLCSVLQLLQKYPEDERYKNAQEKIKGIEVDLGMEKGEVKCFEEKPADSRN